MRFLPSRAFLCLCTGSALVLASPLALAADSSPALPDPAPAEWTPPVMHTALLLTGIRSFEAVLYPDPFADMRPRSWASHAGDSLTYAPLFDSQARAFEWDHDPWTINVIGHGLMGSELYLRPRMCGFGAGGALLFAAGSTIAWEYAFEGNGVRPSAQDLVYTPLAGIVLGEARYWALRAAGRVEARPLRAALRITLDPFGELERRTGVFPC